VFTIPLIFFVVSAPKGVDYDVIFSLTAGLRKVYPNFFDNPHSLVYKNEEKFRVHLMHTGTPSARGLDVQWQPISYAMIALFCNPTNYRNGYAAARPLRRHRLRIPFLCLSVYQGPAVNSNTKS